MLKVILLALSGSIDSWALGAAYHAAEIRIPWTTKGVVALISAIASLFAVLLGEGMGLFINPYYIQAAGGLVLIILGGKSIWDVFRGEKEKNYDTDESKTIEPVEGIVLGGVLASDSFCAGMSLCGVGSAAYVFPAVAGALTFLFLELGERKVRCSTAYYYFAGVALIGIGVVQMLGL